MSRSVTPVRWVRTGLAAVARLALLLLVLPMTAFVVVGSVAPEFHLARYEYDPGAGFVPVPRSAAEMERPGAGELARFFTRFVGGLITGAPGRSREAADRPLTELLADRAAPSLAILAVALTLSLSSTVAGALLALRGTRRGGRWRRLAEVLTAPGATILEGLPLPFVGMMAFVAVVRAVPRGGWLESDGALLLWAGLALALGDAVTTGMVRAARGETRRALDRPYVLAARLRGESALATLAPNLIPVLGARARGAMLLFLGGLVVVEPALGINGLGETFKDIVTDRAGTDVLLFAGVLVMLAIPVALADIASHLWRAAGTEGET